MFELVGRQLGNDNGDPFAQRAIKAKLLGHFADPPARFPYLALFGYGVKLLLIHATSIA
jgi:hypothetical protein